MNQSCQSVQKQKLSFPCKKIRGAAMCAAPFFLYFSHFPIVDSAKKTDRI